MVYSHMIVVLNISSFYCHVCHGAMLADRGRLFTQLTFVLLILSSNSLKTP